MVLLLSMFWTNLSMVKKLASLLLISSYVVLAPEFRIQKQLPGGTCTLLRDPTPLPAFTRRELNRLTRPGWPGNPPRWGIPLHMWTRSRKEGRLYGEIGRIYTRDEVSNVEFILEDDLSLSDDLASWITRLSVNLVFRLIMWPNIVFNLFVCQHVL